MTTTPNPRLERALAHWDGGPYMDFLHPVTEGLIKGASLRPGMRVLDVGSGFGDPTLDVAAVVGPGGTVTGVDHDAQSVAFATRRAADRGVKNVAFAQMEALDLRFPDGTFDAAVSRLVVVYFANPVPFLQQILRVLAPGGRAAVATWTVSERNPLMNAPMDALRRHLPPAPLPAQPADRMDTRDPRILQQALERAGFVDTTSEVVPLVARLRPEDVETYWEERRAGSPASLQILARLTPEQQAAAETDALETVRRLIREGRATGEIAVASGRKP